MARELAIENGKLKSDLDANENKVTNLATPTSDNDAATKKYVDERGFALDDIVTEISANGVKSSGIWSFVKSLFPEWLTPEYEEPATVASVNQKADKDTTYTKTEVDDKITRFVAHYLTDRVDGRFVPFATHARLAEAKAQHTEANPRFFYAGQGFTPTKNDYCVILADETMDGKTTRYSYVGEWPTGSWQYQYTINDTAFSQEQWDAINSGMTAALVTWLSLFKGGDTSTTLASVLSVIAGKLDKTDVLKQSEVTDSTPYGKAADAKDLKEALDGVITEDDVKRVYNSNNTQYIDGNGDVYTSYFEQGGHWNMTWSAGDVNLYYIGYETSLSSYRWRDPNNYNRIVTYNPSSGRVGASGSSVDTGRKSLNPENGDDIGGPYVISGATLTFFKQSSVFPETPSDSVVKKSDVVAPTGSATIDTSKAAQAESTRVALGGKLDKTDGGVVTGDLELDGEVVINGNVRADTDVQINGNLSVNNDYTADFDKLKINGYYLTAYVDGEERWFDFPAKDGTFAVEEDFSTTAPADYVAAYTQKNATTLAPAYDPSKTYAVDTPVTYGGRLYKCTTAITTAEAWNPAHWTEFAATDADTAFVTDDNGHLVAKDTATGDDLYVDAYRMNSGTTIKDAAFNDLGTIAEGASFALPAAIAGHMRDFAVIMQIGATVPSFTFPLTNSDLEPWSEGVPEWTANTIYRITITEARSNKWEIHVASKEVA